MNDRLLTTKELSVWIKRPVRTLESDRVNGEGIPFIRIGKRDIRYRESDVQAWLTSRTFSSRAAELARQAA